MLYQLSYLGSTIKILLLCGVHTFLFKSQLQLSIIYIQLMLHIVPYNNITVWYSTNCLALTQSPEVIVCRKAWGQ